MNFVKSHRRELKTHREIQKLGKQQKLCINYDQVAIADLQMNRWTEYQIEALIDWLIYIGWCIHRNMIESGSTIVESRIFNILIEILSWSWVFPTLNDVIILIIFLFSNLVEESLVFVM